MRRLPFLVLGAILSLVVIANGLQLDQAFGDKSASAQAGPCGLAQAAFCDTFDQPAGIGNRSGDLSGVWGISRVNGGITASSMTDPWGSSSRNTCGTTMMVAPETDNTVCNHMWVESQDDLGGYTVLAGYPKQPFDIAGRTGKVVFDVNADFINGLGHGAWPSFVYTDQPVPAPHLDATTLSDFPRNSIGFGVFDVGPCPAGSVTIRDFWFTQNYQFGRYPFTAQNCVVQPTAYGQLNHFEVDISSTSITILGTDAGKAPTAANLKVLVSVSNVTVPLTRGLIWLEDTHYHGNKSGSTQQVHTFTWANVGFDGPLLPRDLAFDAPDRTPNDLGYFVPATIQVPGITASNISAAAGALLTFNFYPRGQENVTYSVNGHASHTFAWPFGNVSTYKWQTLGVPVPLGEIVPGTNTLQISTTSNNSPVANIDVVLVGAGGIVPPSGSGPPPTATNTPVPATPTNTPVTPANTATPTNTPVNTPTPTNTAVTPPTVVPAKTAVVSAPTFVQANSVVPQSLQSTVSVAYTQTQTAGNLNVVVIGWNDSTSNIVTVRDSVGNTYQVAAYTARGTGVSQAIYYAANIKSAPAGANRVTVTFDEAVAFADIRNLEYKGVRQLNPFDVTESSAGSGSTASSGSATTHAAKELIVGAGMTDWAFTGPGSGFNSRVITNPDADIAEDRRTTTAGSYAATSPQIGNWVMQMATFIAAGQ